MNFFSDGPNRLDGPRPKKTLGQHWLWDEVSLAAMCEAADVNVRDVVLEIGPGTGALTRKLVERAGQVIAVEFDRQLAADLSQKVPSPNLTVIHEDILRFDLTSLPPGYKVVANIPYYLTSLILRLLCTTPNPSTKMALLVQKEIAERVSADPGHMSLLAISVQFYCDVSLGRIVPRNVFEPAPKVDSQILILTPRPIPLLPDVDTKKFFRLVKAGFSNRRKTLLNSLSAGLAKDKLTIVEVLAAAHVKHRVRPQELSLTDWYTLYEVAVAQELL